MSRESRWPRLLIMSPSLHESSHAPLPRYTIQFPLRLCLSSVVSIPYHDSGQVPRSDHRTRRLSICSSTTSTSRPHPLYNKPHLPPHTRCVLLTFPHNYYAIGNYTLYNTLIQQFHHNSDILTPYMQYLRQLVDGGGVYTLGKPNTLSTIENLSIFAGFTTTSSSCLPSPRLLRHFSLIPLPQLVGGPLTTILTHSLRSHCCGRAEQEAGITQSLASIVESTAEVFLRVRESLSPSQLPGRYHYLFSLSHIESAFQVHYNYSPTPISLSTPPSFSPHPHPTLHTLTCLSECSRNHCLTNYRGCTTVCRPARLSELASVGTTR